MVGVTLIAGERAPAESDRRIALDELIRNDILIGCGCGLKREKRLSGDGERILTVRSQRRRQRSNHSLMSIVMLFTRWFETHSGGNRLSRLDLSLETPDQITVHYEMGVT